MKKKGRKKEKKKEGENHMESSNITPGLEAFTDTSSFSGAAVTSAHCSVSCTFASSWHAATFNKYLLNKSTQQVKSNFFCTSWFSIENHKKKKMCSEVSAF